MLIVFEGIDGSGKNTQILMLQKFLRQHKVKWKLHKYPTKKAKEALAHLSGSAEVAPERLADVFANDILEEKEKIDSEIEAGFVVICDRYPHSTLAYQGARMEFDSLAARLEEKGATVPDIVVLLDLAGKDGAKRKARQKEPDRFEKDVKFLGEVGENYRRMERECFLAFKYVVIDASQPAGRVFSEVITAIEPLVIKKII